jgi:hypothetical protein
MDDVGADGLTVREAIARRVMIGLGRLAQAHKSGELGFEAAYLGIKVLVETTLPFVDPTSAQLINQIMKLWDEEAKEQQRAALELAAAAGKSPLDVGAWGTWST